MAALQVIRHGERRAPAPAISKPAKGDAACKDPEHRTVGAMDVVRSSAKTGLPRGYACTMRARGRHGTRDGECVYSCRALRRKSGRRNRNFGSPHVVL
eukprot:1412107-Prymnesium_polylepis.2